MNELYFIAAIVAGFAALIYRDRARRNRQLDTAARRGLAPAEDGLRHLPKALQRTVLFLVGDGGQERGVMTGEFALAKNVAKNGVDAGDGAADSAGPATVEMTVFDLALHRDVRGEWGYLNTKPRFRIFSPVTVIALELPREYPHVLIKRRGRAEHIAEEGLERYKSLVDIARDISAIERAVAVQPPPGLPAEPLLIANLSDYLVWSADAEAATAVLGVEVTEILKSPAATSRELVIELLDSLMLVYCASDGDLPGTAADSLITLAEDLCRQISAGAGRRPAGRDAETNEDSDRE